MKQDPQEKLNFALLKAAECGAINEIEELLKSGAHIHTADFMLGSAPMHYAALEGHVAAIKVLLDNGADIEDRDKMYSTPLHCASSEGHEGAIKMLLENKAEIFARDKFGYTPLHLAMIRTQVSAVKVLLEHFEKRHQDGIALFDLNGQTPLSALLTISFKSSHLEKTIEDKILILFKMFFLHNPRILFLSDINHKKAKSPFLRLLRDVQSHSSLKQALLDFTLENLKSFTEKELFYLAFHLHERPDIFLKLERFELKNRAQCERGSISPTDLSDLINRHFHPKKKFKFGYFFKDFSSVDIWRIFVDGNKQITEHGWKGYEQREPGCIDNMYQAWKYIEKTAQEPLSIEHIKQIHSLCSINIVKSTQPGEFRTENCKFAVNFTFNGYIQFCRNFSELANLKKSPKNFFEIYPIKKGPQIVNEINHILENYHLQLKTANADPLKILMAIIELCHYLEILHPFADCNLRTFCTLILNRELIRQGFTPVLLENPHRFDGFSFNEMLYEILRGMNDFQQFKETKCYKNCKSTKELVYDMNLPYPIPELISQLEKPSQPLLTVQFNLLNNNIKSAPHQDTTFKGEQKIETKVGMFC